MILIELSKKQYEVSKLCRIYNKKVTCDGTWLVFTLEVHSPNFEDRSLTSQGCSVPC
jgi:hypothetical protein